MGQNESAFKKTYSDTVSQLSSVQLGEITSKFNELYTKAGGAKGLVVDREAFSQYLNVPVAVGDRLFEAFDEKKNGSICFEEFVCGLAIVLHGSFREKCSLLFRVFNIGNDEGVSHEELRTMLTAIFQSTNTILYTVGHTDRAVLGGEDTQETINAMVTAAFANCDISRTGKLLPMEFEYWLKRNPKVLDTLLSFKTGKDECTLGSLIMSPSEQNLQPSPSLPKRPTPRGSLGSHTPTNSRERLQPPTDGQSSGFPTPTIGGPGRPVFQVGDGDESSLCSRQSSVTSNLQSVAMESQSEEPTEASHGESITAPLAGESPVRINGDRLCRQDADVTKEASVSQGVIETDPDHSEPPITIAIKGSEETDQPGGVVEPNGDRIATGSANSTFTAENESQAPVDSAAVGSAESSGAAITMGVDSETTSAVAMESAPTESDVSCLELPGVPSTSSEVPIESAGSAGDVIDIRPSPSISVALESAGDTISIDPALETPGGTGNIISIGPTPSIPGNVIGIDPIPGSASGDVATAGGSIMASASELTMNIAAVPQVDLGGGPASPVLPIQEVVGGALSGSDGKQDLSVEGGKEMVENIAGIQLSEPCPLTGDPVLVAATHPQQPKAPLPSPLKESVSPFPEEVEEAQCSESISQAWVLSKWTRDLLERSQADGSHLTCPALMTDVKLHDGINDLLAAHYPDYSRRTLLTVDQVSMDAQGLRRLVSSGSLHSALELTARFLSAHGQGFGQAGQPTIHTHKTLQMWSARVALLMHLRMYRDAELELQAFGEMLNPDLYYQYHTHSYPGKKGSLVPFTLRLLHATLPRYTADTQLALDRLCRLQGVCEQVLSEVKDGRLPDATEPLSDSDQEIAEKLWRERLCRTKCSLANALITLQDYGVAVRLYEEVAEQQPLHVRTEILSGVGRLFLQLGDVRTALSYFDRVELELGEEKERSPLVKMNDGYHNVFLSRWQAAFDCFKAALTFDPSNVIIQSNITVCTFYMGRLKESIKDMEQLLISSPPSSLQPSLLANLATTYELESGNSSWKKLSYIPLLGQHVGQGYRHLAELNIR